MKKKGAKDAINVSNAGRIRSVPENLNIVWGKRYSLKDRSPTVALIMFLVLMLCVLSFLSVMKKDESSVENKGESSSSVGEVNKSYGNDLYINISSDANNDVVLR